MHTHVDIDEETLHAHFRQGLDGSKARPHQIDAVHKMLVQIGIIKSAPDW